MVYSLFSQNDYKEIPPGTIKINDSLYMDVAPIDNLMFVEYYSGTHILWNETVSDSIDKLPYFGLKKTEPRPNSLHVPIHPKYSLFPKISISKEEAERFCKWRTDMVKIHWGSISKNLNERKQYPLKFKYRLPTSKELAKAIDSFGYIKGIKSDSKMVHYKAYRLEYKRKDKKILFIKDNLSEFTLDSNPFGTNWRNIPPLNEASDYTSFRCVCEILD